jgi:pyruvate dehydrogenase E1 component alpha subunit
MAQLWKLPVVYVCENNLYNEYTHHSETTAGSMKARAEAFGIHTQEVNGQDVRAVFETAQQLIERARRGEGPAFLLCNTYRYYGHHVGDINRSYYRAKEEEQEWRNERDPLQLLARWLMDEGLADAGIFEQIEKEVAQEIQEGVEFALNAPFPKADEVTEDVYA